MPERYFVFDTNALISALLIKTSISREAFDKALREGTLLLSPATLEELNDVLKREKFNRYVLEHERIQFLTALIREALMVEVTETINACRDPKDNKFLELAVSGQATCLISGDQDLLVLHPFRGIPVLSPRDFIKQDYP